MTTFVTSLVRLILLERSDCTLIDARFRAHVCRQDEMKRQYEESVQNPELILFLNGGQVNILTNESLPLFLDCCGQIVTDSMP